MKSSGPGRFLRPLLLCGLASCSVGAVASSAVEALKSRPSPLDPSAAVPPLAYRSALSDHRAYRASDVGSWPQANETVNRIGGWRSYARETDGASVPGTPGTPANPGSSSPPAKPAAPAGHRHP